MYRWQIMQAITEQRVVGIIRESSPEAGRAAGGRLLDAGLRAVEVSFTSAGTLDVLRDLAATAPPGAVIGAGTVLDATTARLAVLAGARFLVSPTLTREVIETGHRYGVPVIPGTFTATEVEAALSAGADAIKIFPASSLGTSVLGYLAGPLPQVPFIPTGGITVEAAPDWIRAGAVAVGLGNALSAGNPEETAERVRALLGRLQQS